ncbi:TonB-dependent receptor [Sphingomonas naphthae]|uniref:TonB-dependent receptor n=1 Tax=Sphingomonas naphthae TaxID=1813468 RepID=A0ABY7TJW0_9SPHN|nr:TonB-dependent receptor [Sphingomonas naphthae]WCT73507.1 TonB-dependent receptor [Sphingomonas naphthae]
MNRIIRTTCIHLLGGTALLGAMPVLAQTAPPATPAAPAAQAGLDEIVVTAQRRAENLQKVPIAVTAVTANSLKNSGVNATADLPQLVPSVQVTRSGPSGLFFIRGVGTTNAAAGEEGANAIYIDGVYLGDLSQTFNNFNNIERVEVLKGPQGTLFGRNATGGLIHIITREPGRDLVIDGQAGYANYDTVSSQLYVGGPISDKISADVATTYSHQGKGWGRNLTLNRENKKGEYGGIRSKIVARPTDDIKIVLGGDYYKNKDNLGLAFRLADGQLGTGGNVGPTGHRGHDTTANFPALTRLKLWGLNGTVEGDLGFATLTSITGLRRTRNKSAFDVDGGPINLINISYVAHARTFQEELRLASHSGGPLTWQVGGFYLKSKATTDQNQNGLAFAPTLSGTQIVSSLATRSLAAFAEATYEITPTTKLTGGIRYTDDKRDFDGNQTPILASGTRLATTTVISTLKYSEVTYRAALRQEITPDISIYGSVNKGFKAGAYSLQSPTSPSVNPQYIMAYEAGLKTEFFNRRLRVNIAAYHYDIDDYQIRSAATATPGTQVLLNAATVKVDGFDLEYEARPTQRLRFFGGFTALKSKFDQFGGPNAQFQAPIVYPSPATCPVALRGTENPGVLGAGPRTGGYTICLGDVSGNYTPLAPKFTGSAGTSYTLPVGSGEIRFSGLFSYNSGYYFDPDNVRHQRSFTLLNGSVEYRPTQRIGVEVFARNIGKTRYRVQDLTTATGTTSAFGAPLTYGVNLKFKY